MPSPSSPLSGSLQRRERWIAGGILAGGLFLRVVVVIATRHHWHPLNDGFDYNRIAESLAKGHGYGNAGVPPAQGPSAFRPPLYPFLLTPVYWLFGPHVTLGRLENAVIGTAAVAAIGILAYQLWGRRVALVAMALAAIYPPLLLASFGLQYEALLITLTCTSLAAGLQFRRQPQRWGWLILSGLLAGLATLTRENAFVLLIPLGVLACLPLRKHLALAGRLAVLATSCLAVIAPWTIRNIERLHTFVPVSTSLGYAVEGAYNHTAANYPNNPTLWLPPTNDPATTRLLLEQANRSEPSIDRTLRSAAIRYIEDHPGYPVKVMLWNTVRLFDLHGFKDSVFIANYIPYNIKLVKVAVVSFYVVAALAIFGAFTANARRVPFAVWLFPILVFFTLVPVTANLRYRSVLEPFFVMLASLTVVRVIDRVIKRNSALAKAEPT